MHVNGAHLVARETKERDQRERNTKRRERDEGERVHEYVNGAHLVASSPATARRVSKSDTSTTSDMSIAPRVT